MEVLATQFITTFFLCHRSLSTSQQHFVWEVLTQMITLLMMKKMS